jgi:polyhydroxybutyrate depolymerase
VNRLVDVFVLSALAISVLVNAAPSPSFAAEQIIVGGRTRTFVLERPSSPGPRPTIILLHGAGGSGAAMAQSEAARLGLQAGFVMVFPDARARRWSHLPPGKEADELAQAFREDGGAPDDVGFLRTLVADLVRHGISNAKQVYLAGVSAGGVLTLRMACLGEGTFAAIALVVASMPDATGAVCRASGPLPVLMIHGTADDVMPYVGGRGVLPGTQILGPYSIWPAERMVEFFRRHNGCAEPAERSVLSGSNPHRVEVARSIKCRGGAVFAYRVVGGGTIFSSRLRPPVNC